MSEPEGCPPRFIHRFPKDMVAVEGEGLVLEALVVGYPPPEVWWYRDGFPMQEDDYHEVEFFPDGECGLVFHYLRGEDEGEYECRAKNPFGQVSCFGELRVELVECDRRVDDDLLLPYDIPCDDIEGRQSGLFILIDEGSADEDDEFRVPGSSHRLLSACEQIEGIIEDLTMAEGTASISLGREGVFMSDDSQEELSHDKESNRLLKYKGLDHIPEGGSDRESEDGENPALPVGLANGSSRCDDGHQPSELGERDTSSSQLDNRTSTTQSKPSEDGASSLDKDSEAQEITQLTIGDKTTCEATSAAEEDAAAPPLSPASPKVDIFAPIQITEVTSPTSPPTNLRSPLVRELSDQGDDDQPPKRPKLYAIPESGLSSTEGVTIEEIVDESPNIETETEPIFDTEKTLPEEADSAIASLKDEPSEDTKHGGDDVPCTEDKNQEEITKQNEETKNPQLIDKGQDETQTKADSPVGEPMETNKASDSKKHSMEQEKLKKEKSSDQTTEFTFKMSSEKKVIPETFSSFEEVREEIIVGGRPSSIDDTQFESSILRRAKEVLSNEKEDEDFFRRESRTSLGNGEDVLKRAKEVLSTPEMEDPTEDLSTSKLIRDIREKTKKILSEIDTDLGSSKKSDLKSKILDNIQSEFGTETSKGKEKSPMTLFASSLLKSKRDDKTQSEPDDKRNTGSKEMWDKDWFSESKMEHESSNRRQRWDDDEDDLWMSRERAWPNSSEDDDDDFGRIRSSAAQKRADKTKRKWKERDSDFRDSKSREDKFRKFDIEEDFDTKLESKLDKHFSETFDDQPIGMSVTKSLESYSYSKTEEYVEESYISTSGNAVTQSKTVTYSETCDTDDSKSEPVFDLYVAIADYTPDGNDAEAVPLAEGQIVEVLDSNSSQRWLVRTRPTKTAPGKQGWVPPSYLEKKTLSSTLKSIQDILEMEVESKMEVKEKEAERKRAQVVKELVETEEEFSKDMQHVVNTYLKDFDSAKTPKEIRDLRESIFMNFKQICDFHTNVLIKGVQYYAAEPLKLGKTFLRLERDFDMHVKYCRDEPQAQELLAVSPAKEFFEEYSKRIGEVDKSLRDHLKLPIQRINDYQLLLKELIKYSARLKEDCTDLQKALDLMLSIPQRAHDLKFINSIQGFKGNLFSLGRVLRHDWFTVTDSEGKTKERYLFLFKSRVLITKVRKITEEKSVFILKDIIRLPDVEVRENPTDKCKIELHHKQKGFPRYPLTLAAKTEFVREAWVKELKEHLAELAGVIDLGIEEIEIEPEKSKADTADESETYEELNTVMTESIRSGSMTSTEGLEVPKDDERPTTPGGTPIPHAPVFPIKLKDTELLEGTSITFMIKVRAHPEAEVKFFKDGKDLKQDDRIKIVVEDKETFELNISNVKKEDSGKFSCKAKNSQGEATCEATLRVTDEKKLFEGIEIAAKKQGVIKPGEEPDFKWFRDGQEFEASERFKVMFGDEEDTVALVFRHVKPEDAGLYTCVASTSSGKISCSAELTVQGAVNQLAKEPEVPKFVSELQDTEASSGGSAMLELKISGFPKPNITWEKDGKEVKAGGRLRFLHEDEESIALVIKQVTKEDSGKYKVIAKNELGQATTSANLIVKAPPAFKKQLTDISAMMSEDVRIQVEIEGNPTPEITWYKDGQQVVQSDRIKIVHEKDEIFALVIKKAVGEDAGSYNCVATNASGKSSEFANLTVNVPAAFVKELKTTDIKETETVKLETKVVGSPIPKAKWFKDGEELKADGKHIKIEQDERNHSITIDKAVRKDAGKYTIEVTNEFGKSTSSGELVINCIPEFSAKLSDITVKEGDQNVKFEVKLTGTPLPKIKWYIENMEITEKTNNFQVVSEGETQSLTIKNVEESCAGKITCQATNTMGDVKTSAVINVLTKPKFTQSITDKEVTEGDTVKYTVTVHSNPASEVKWYKNNQEVTVDAKVKITKESSETWSLTLDCVSAATAGDYECRAKNSEGETITKSKLIVNTKPTFDKGIQDQDIWLGLEATLEVKVQGIPYPEVKWIKDDKPIAFGERIKNEKKDNVHTLRITQTLVDDGGNYKCEIKNKIGEIETKAHLTIKTPTDAKEPAVTKQLKDYMSVRYSPATFEARILGNPKPMVTWLKDGKPLQLDAERIIVTEKKEDFLYSLTIDKSVVEDMGKYKILGENEHGTVTSEAELDVKVPPEITISMDRKIMPKGQASFEAKVTGRPQPKVTWCRNGKELAGPIFTWTADDNKQLYVLNVDGADVEDGGEYQCIGENMVGKETKTFNLLITTDLPKFSKVMEDMSVKPTKMCQFDVEVDGIPIPHVKWFFKDAEIKESEKFKFVQHDERNHSLVFNPMLESDAGEYTCKAISKAGEFGCKAKLSVKHEMPFYPKHVPKEVCAIDGEDFTVEAIVDGSPQPTIKWLKDGKEVLPSDRIKMEYFPDTGVARLTVKGAKTEDIGKYTLVAINPTGELSSSGVVKVEIVPKPPSFVEKLKKTDVVQGASMQLTARVSGHPKPSAKWFKDGKPIRPTDPRFRTAEKPDGCIALIIDDAKPEDAGKYGLQVRNSLGESLSEAEVSVKSAPEAPEFLLKPKHTDVFEGMSIRLDGRVRGFPTPTLKWLKDGKDFTPDGERVSTTYKPEDGVFALIINGCKADDTAKYTCVATNSLGENTAVVDLGVRGRTKGGEALCAPSFVTSLSDVDIDEGGPIRMTASVAGNPVPEVKWTKDGQPIASTDTMSINFDGQRVILEIKKGYPKDIGKYECTLSNVEGTTSSISNVKVKKLSKSPVFTQRFPDVSAVLGQDVQFVCRAVGLPNPEATWHFSDKKTDKQLQDSEKFRMKHEADMFALFIKDCQLADIGNITCKIKNTDGEDKCVAFLNVIDTREVKPNTEAPSFLKKLADCDVIEGMAGKFTACISGLPEPEFKWYKDGRELVPTDRIKFEVEAHGLIRLIIKGITKEDMGKYSLKITNSLGSDECSALLNCESSKLPPHMRVKVELPRSRYAYSSSRKFTTRW